MWGPEDDPSSDDEMSVDYSRDSEAEEAAPHADNWGDWRSMALGQGMTEAEIDEYGDFPTLTVTPEWEIKAWSPEEESLNPWVAVEKWYRANQLPNNLDQGEAYWFGSDDLARYMPHMLIKQLGLMEKYWRSWLYSADTRKDRIKKWMDRGKKSQLPCAQGMNGVSSPDGPPGLDSYHFLATYGATEWTPRMMSMETIPLAKRDEKDWAYFATAVISYCYAEKKMDFRKSPNALLFNAQGKEGLRVDPGVEDERLAIVRRAIHHLYGKRGICFFPPRPDQQLGHDEFLIPGFGVTSRHDWTTTHFVVVLGDAPWALTAGELELSSNLRTFYRKVSMKTIGSGGGSGTRSTGPPTVIPDGFRQAFRRAKPGGQTASSPRGKAAQSASASASGAAASGPATTYAPDPATASGTATTFDPDSEWDRGEWEPRQRGDASTWRDQGWDQGQEWSTDPAPNKGKGKGKGSTKGRGKKGKSADRSFLS
jgi:hypothetical protein